MEFYCKIFPTKTTISNAFNVNLNEPFKDGNFRDYVNDSYSERSTIRIEFFGFLSDYFTFWIQNEKNYNLVSTLGFDETDDWGQLASIYHHPIIKILALSDIFQISEFRREFLTAHDVFSHGRKWGRIIIIAQMGSDDEYYAEFPFFFIGFARAPFKVPIGIKKKNMAKSGESFVENLTEVLSTRGHSILGYIFLLGYLSESIYYRPKSLKIKDTYVESNIEYIGNEIIELCKDSGVDNLSEKASKLLENISSIGTDLTRLSEIETYIQNFENFLKSETSLDGCWFYRGVSLKWDYSLKNKMKHSLNSQSSFSYPIILVLPNGDWGVVDLKDNPIKEDHIKIWKNMNRDDEFMAIDLGEDAGVLRIISFSEGDSPGKIIDRHEFDFSSKDFNKKTYCPKRSRGSLICSIINKKCPIDCLLDPPEFGLFFRNCKVDLQIKREILMEVLAIQ